MCENIFVLETLKVLRKTRLESCLLRVEAALYSFTASSVN